MTPVDKSRVVKEIAIDEGFDLVGIASSKSLDDAAQNIQEYVERGNHASMQWLARNPHQRSDPRYLLPECKSIIALAVNYYLSNNPLNISPKPLIGGRIAKYAQLPDYHKTIFKKLKSIKNKLSQALLNDAHYGNDKPSFKLCVDSSSLMEKPWAQEAGIGFIGKNTCLINSQRGSWFLLGIILTNIELEPDHPQVNHCGTCNRCIDACPTNALNEHGQMDARRCISYQTIENRNNFDSPIKNSLNEWLLGCDICQIVCPYNIKFQRASSDQNLLGEPILEEYIDINRILSIKDEEEFKSIFGSQFVLRRPGLNHLRHTVKNNIAYFHQISEKPESLA